MNKNLATVILLLSVFLFACANQDENSKEVTTDTTKMTTDTSTTGIVNTLPPPFHTPSVRNESKVLGWSDGKMPQAPAGFTVTKFADKLNSPRWIYVADNGDIFIAESAREANKSANRITLFKDTNKDGVAESRSVFLKNLNQPFGMLIIGNKFYVGNTDGVVVYDYTAGMPAINSAGKTIVTLPTGRHWTRNIITNANKDKLYIAVGSASNIAEDGFDKEVRRANILVTNLDGTNERVYASGLRNPVGMAWAPATQTLWTAVNERDELGDDLVPDYMTSVKEGGFYGWPYSYFGQIEDPRLKDKQRPDLVQKAIVPEVQLGAHTASLGLVFYEGTSFPQKYHNGAFVGQHGSWNRSEPSGYKVVFVPFNNGKPGVMEDFLTGFMANAEKNEVYGRPVGVAVLADGSLLVADDAGNTVWRISYNK
jgi:glucose/arabinose dehydrogenase